MASVDVRGGIRFDVMANAEIVSAIGKLKAIDHSRRSPLDVDQKLERKRIHRRKATVVRKNLAPFWGILAEETIPAEPIQGFVSVRKEIKGESVLAGSTDANITGGIVFTSSNILKSARYPEVHDELLIGEVVLGRSIGNANPPQFSEEHFAALIDMADGIRGDSSRQVIRSLREIDRFIDKDDISYRDYGRVSNGDIYEGSYGKMAMTAKVIDNWYVPALQTQETAGAFVSNSVVYAPLDVFPSVLGGEVEHSIIGTLNDIPFDNAHILVSDSILLTGRSRRETIKGLVRYGHPEKAKDVVQAFAEIGPAPLVQLAA